MEVNTTYEPYAQEPEYIDANRGLLQSLPLAEIRRVLDLACGTGLLTDILLGIKPDAVVNGVDISGEQIAIARRQFAERGLLAEDQHALDTALSEGRGAAMFQEGSADELDFAPGTFDLAMMGNAIHLMPDKDRFLTAVARVLHTGGYFTFNSVFFVGTFEEGTEPVYTEWLKQAFEYVQRKDAERRAAGLEPIRRQRGKHGRAFDKGWMSGDEWQAKLETQGFEVVRNAKRTVPISQRGLELVGAYGGLSEVLMTGYPVDVASEALMAAVGPAFDKFGITELPRNWLEIAAVKR